MTQATTLCQLRNKRVSHVNYDVGLPQWLPRQCFFKIQLPCLKSKTCSQNRWATAYLCIASIASHTHKNVTLGLQGFGKIFFHGEGQWIFQGVAKNIFSREAKSGEMTFCPLETKKTTFFCQAFIRKIWNFQIKGDLGPPFRHPWKNIPPFLTPLTAS